MAANLVKSTCISKGDGFGSSYEPKVRDETCMLSPLQNSIEFTVYSFEIR